MKNIFKFLAISFFTLLLVNCEDESKSPYDIGVTSENTGSMATIDIITPVLNITDLTGSAFTAVISTPSNNITTYDISVQRLGADGFEGEVKFLKSLTSFPAELSINAEEISTALDVPVSDFLAGDEFVITASITDTNDRVFTISNVDSDLASEAGQKQAFEYSTFISCPFVASDIVGTYAVEEGGGLYSAGTTFNVIAGPEDNQYSIVAFGDTDLVINVDPDTGVSTPSKEVFLTFASGLAIAPAANPSGFTFSCTGKISLKGLTYTCCGNFPLILNKI